MDKIIFMTSDLVKKQKTGVFIDGSNMLWGSKESGIKIDWQKMKDFLEESFSPIVFNYYACEDNNPSTDKYLERTKSHKKFLNKLEGIGYKVIRKDLKHLQCGKTKCDMDVELTMDIRNYEKDINCIILFTGDSDYLSAVEYYWNSGMYIRIFSFEELLSWELKTFAIKNPRCSYKTINSIKDKISRD